MIAGDIILDAPKIATAIAFGWRSTLDGRDFDLRMCWNDRAKRWSLDVSGADGVELALGLGLSCDVSSWGGIVDARLPPGALFVHDSSGQSRAPGRHSFRSSHALVYRPAAVAAGASESEAVP